MTAYRKCISLLILVTGVLVGAACSERDSSAPGQGALPEEAHSQVPLARQVASSSASQVPVRILPESPKAGDDLRAVVSGVRGKFSYRWEVNGASVDGGTKASLPGEAFQKDDQVAVVVSINGQEFRVETSIRNTPPEIMSLSVLPRGFFRGIDIIAKPVGRDVDGDSISYSYLWLINGEERLGETSATLSGEQFTRGDRVSVVVTPFDGEGNGKPVHSHEIPVGNAPPRFVTSPPSLPKDSSIYQYAVRAEDLDDDLLTYRLEAAPEGMRIDEKTGYLTWRIRPAHAGENLVRIVVSDPHGAQTAQEYSINLTFSD